MSYRPLGFEYQPYYEDSCGAYALGHALNLVGITGEIENHKYSSNFVSWTKSVKKNFSVSGLRHPIKAIKKISDAVGTAENGISKGIRKASCNPIHIDNYSEIESQNILTKLLDQGFPVILHASRRHNSGYISSHWNVCAGRMGSKYIFIDSWPLLSNKNVVSLYNWDEISRRSIEYDEESSYFQFFGIAVQPKDKISAVPHLHKVLPQLFRDESLREWWGYYLEDLRYMFDKTGTEADVISSKEFFTRYNSSFIENVDCWNPDFGKPRLQKEINNYALVAEAYNFAISKSRLDEALISFTAALTTAAQVD